MAREVPFLSSQMWDGGKLPITQKLYFTNSSVLLADMVSFAEAYLPLLDHVSQSQIVNAWLHLPITLPSGIKSAPVAAGNNDIQGAMRFTTNIVGVRYTYNFPNFIPAGFLSTNEEIIDQSQADVANMIAFLVATTDSTVVDGDQENALTGTAPIKATKINRKQRRARGKLR